MYKWKPLRSCRICGGKGCWTSCFDQDFRCDCFKKTKAWKNRKKLKPKYNYIPFLVAKVHLGPNKLFKRWWIKNMFWAKWGREVEDVCRESFIVGYDTGGGVKCGKTK